MVLEKILESPLDTRRSNQLILKEINPEYSLEGLMLKLKLQYFGHLMQRAHLLEKTLMLGKIVSKRRRRQQRITHVRPGVYHHRQTVFGRKGESRKSPKTLS